MRNNHTIAYALKSAVEPHTLFLDGRNPLYAVHEFKTQSDASNLAIALGLAWAYGDDVPASTLGLEALEQEDNTDSLMVFFVAELA